MIDLKFHSSKLMTRAAIDVGSGAIKSTVADVNTDTNQIVNVRHECSKTLELGKAFALSLDGSLKEPVQLQLLDVLKEMQAEAQRFSPQEWLGVGTSVFRKAANGPLLLERIKAETDLTIRLISQIEEAEIGFLSAIAVSRLKADSVHVWDSGSGSFQISTLIDDRLEMYGSENSFVHAFEMLFSNRKESLSHDCTPNPVSFNEALRLVKSIRSKLPPVPSWLLAGEKQIVAIGGVLSIFAFAKIATGQSDFTQNEILHAITTLCGKHDTELSAFPSPKDTLVRIILLYAVMQHCGFEKVCYFPTNGGCEGLLITPRYW